MKRRILAEVFEQGPPGPLYHYTSQSGLLGIIRTGEIWATHTQYLNDTREYLHALEMVHQQLQVSIGECSTAESRSILEEMDEDVRAADGKGVRGVDGNVCVSSFSEDRDSLSQWRAYASATPGFAIGIPGEHLKKLVAKQEFYLARCIYERPQQEALIRALIAEVVEQNAEWRATGEKVYTPRGGNLHAYLWTWPHF